MVNNNVLKGHSASLISITNKQRSQRSIWSRALQDIREILQDLVRKQRSEFTRIIRFVSTDKLLWHLNWCRAWIVKDDKLCLSEGQGEETWALPGVLVRVTGYSPKENILRNPRRNGLWQHVSILVGSIWYQSLPICKAANMWNWYLNVSFSRIRKFPTLHFEGENHTIFLPSAIQKNIELPLGGGLWWKQICIVIKNDL